MLGDTLALRIGRRAGGKRKGEPSAKGAVVANASV
jgi:hypothetical protein